MRKIWLVLAIAFLMVGSTARADPVPAFVEFDWTRVIGNLDHCTTRWLLPNNVPPDFYYGGFYPAYRNVTATSNCDPGYSWVIGPIIFFPSDGIAFTDGILGTSWSGASLFQSTTSGILFRIGTFNLLDEFGRFDVVLTIRPAPALVPEPTLWSLLMAGVAVLLFVRRRARPRGACARARPAKPPYTRALQSDP